MRLTLSMTGPAGGAARSFSSGTVHIGRAAENDWVLADPQRHLSKRHCTLTFRDGFWEVTDLSTNGTFLNDERIGANGVRDLRDGDVLRLGHYEVEVGIADDATPGSIAPLAVEPWRESEAWPGSQPWRAAEPLPADPLSADPSSADRGGAKLLDSFGLSDGDPFGGPVQPDHSPGIEDAFRPPKPVALLDDDWDLSVEGLAPGGLTPGGLTPEGAPPAVRPVLSDAPPAPAPPPAATDDLMGAFLRGAGMPDARPADPVAAMESLGAAFRALAGGLRETLMARAAVKSEFRIEATMIRAQGNNPLKFSASDDDALLALLGTGRRSTLSAEAAIAEALQDIRLHELATMAAMQTAVRGLLRELDPAKMRDGGGLLEAQRKARAWDTYEAAHARLSQAMADSFDSAFGRSFARAYEQALRDAKQGSQR